MSIHGDGVRIFKSSVLDQAADSLLMEGRKEGRKERRKEGRVIGKLSVREGQTCITTSTFLQTFAVYKN